MAEEVDVLLATLNGEKYIEEFLLSLSRQIGVKINLIVSDDGSSDSTMKIVENFIQKFQSVKIIQGPKRGVISNFMQMLQYSKSEYVAFADQDDYWIEHHLMESIGRLKSISNRPGMTFSRVKVFTDDDKSHFKLWPKGGLDLDPRNFLFQNFSRGCTMVMNSSLRKLINPNFDGAIMHDWWISLIALTHGVVIFGERPEIFYRIHCNNTVGESKGIWNRSQRTLKNLTSNSWGPIDQINSLLNIYGQSMGADFKNLLSEILQITTNSNIIRRVIFAFTSYRYRENFLDEFALRIHFLKKWKLL